MKLITTLLVLLMLTSCNTEDSDEIEDQSKIHGIYKVTKNQNSSYLDAEVTFYESGSGFFSDYVALRGRSYVSFQGIRMQEVRNWLDQTSYEQKIKLRTGHIDEDLSFSYLNNDGKLFEVKLVTPSTIKYVQDSLIINSGEKKTTISLSWELDQIRRNSDKTKVIAILKGSATQKQLPATSMKNIVIVIDSDTLSEYDRITLCSYKLNKGIPGPSKRGYYEFLICNDDIAL